MASAARGVTATVCDDGQAVNESDAGATVNAAVLLLATLITTGDGVPMVPEQETVTVCAVPPSAKVNVDGADAKVALVGGINFVRAPVAVPSA